MNLPVGRQKAIRAAHGFSSALLQSDLHKLISMYSRMPIPGVESDAIIMRTQLLRCLKAAKDIQSLLTDGIESHNKECSATQNTAWSMDFLFREHLYCCIRKAGTHLVNIHKYFGALRCGNTKQAKTIMTSMDVAFFHLQGMLWELHPLFQDQVVRKRSISM